MCDCPQEHELRAELERLDADYSLVNALLTRRTEALSRLEPMVCGWTCPSVKRTEEPWTHSAEHEAIRSLSGKVTGAAPRCKARKHDKHVEEASDGRSYPCHCRCVPPAPYTSEKEWETFIASDGQPAIRRRASEKETEPRCGECDETLKGGNHTGDFRSHVFVFGPPPSPDPAPQEEKR